MKPKSYLIEIAWPKLGWIFCYLGQKVNKFTAFKVIPMEITDYRNIDNYRKCIIDEMKLINGPQNVTKEMGQMDLAEFAKKYGKHPYGKKCDVKPDMKLFIDALDKVESNKEV